MKMADFNISLLHQYTPLTWYSSLFGSCDLQSGSSIFGRQILSFTRSRHTQQSYMGLIFSAFNCAMNLMCWTVS